MTLGQKTLAILFLTVAGLAAVLYTTTRVLLLGQFRNIEHTEVRRSVERAANALADKVNDLGKTTNDYGAWDRTYEFMQHPLPEYIQQEFSDETLHNLGINSVVIINPQGEVVYFKSYAAVHKHDVLFTEEVPLDLVSSPWVRRVQTAHKPASGIVQLPWGPALIAACPILTSKRTGPARGVMVMTLDMDPTFMDDLRAQTRSSLAIEEVRNPRLPHDFLEAKADIEQTGQPIVVQHWNSDIVAGYEFLDDVNGKPLLLLRVDTTPDILRQGEASLRYFLVALFGISIVFGCVTLFLLRHTVLARLTRLNNEISRIGQQRNLTLRVTVKGKDEVATLQAAINTMIEALQSGDTQFREIAENIRQVFWVRDQTTQKLSYISPPWENVLGLKRENLYSDSRAWLDSVHLEDRPAVDEMLARQRGGEKGEAEFRIILPDSSLVWIWCRYFPVFNAGGRLSQIVGMAEDITEYKRAEQTLLRSQEDLWNVMMTAAGGPLR